MRKAAEILLRSTIAETAAYLKMVVVDSNVQVETIRVLAHAMRIADSISAEPSDEVGPDDLAELRRVATRLAAAVAVIGPPHVRSWIDRQSAQIIAFCENAELRA